MLFQTYFLESNISLSDYVGPRSDCTFCADDFDLHFPQKVGESRLAA